MSSAAPTSYASAPASGLNRGWMLAVGLVQVAIGVIGLTMAYSFTLIALFWFGLLAVIAGIGQLLDGFHHQKWRGVIGHILVGIVYVAAGLALIFLPASAAFWLTLVIAISLVLTGIIRVLTAIVLRGNPGLQLFTVVTGLVSIVLGILIYRMVAPPGPEALATVEDQVAWVRSWGWVIGVFVAIELILEGVTLIMTAFTAKSERPA